MSKDSPSSYSKVEVMPHHDKKGEIIVDFEFEERLDNLEYEENEFAGSFHEILSTSSGFSKLKAEIFRANLGKIDPSKRRLYLQEPQAFEMPIDYVQNYLSKRGEAYFKRGQRTLKLNFKKVRESFNKRKSLILAEGNKAENLRKSYFGKKLISIAGGLENVASLDFGHAYNNGLYGRQLLPTMEGIAAQAAGAIENSLIRGISRVKRREVEEKVVPNYKERIPLE